MSTKKGGYKQIHSTDLSLQGSPRISYNQSVNLPTENSRAKLPPRNRQSVNEKYKLKQLDDDNQRLFEKIHSIEKNVQISFLGLNKETKASAKLRQSGIRDLSHTSNKHILFRDMVRAKGGHSMQQSLKRNKSIEQENLRILIALAR